MGDPNLVLLGSTSFNPDKYVRELSQSCIGGPELIRVRKKIQSISEDTGGNLKKNVYENYMQFIDTAKEISHLESEMYQLSHLLTEQKSLLNLLYNTSIIGEDTHYVIESDFNKIDKEERKEELRKQKLASLKDKIKGCHEIVDAPNRTILYESFLTELDVVDNTLIQAVYGVLFSNGFMLANSDSREGQLKYDTFYELGAIAVVNVRDLSNVKHAFKLLAYPNTRVFQCKSSSIKKDWLDKFDQAKKGKLSHEQPKSETPVEKSPSRMSSLDVPYLNPFDEVDEEVATHPNWVVEVPDELDVCIAQRHFEEALVLLEKGKEYILSCKPTSPQFDDALSDIRQKIEQKEKTLINVLVKELEVSPDKSLQGGLRAARRSVKLLNQLGMSLQACEMFLVLCSTIMKTQFKRVKRECSTVVYVRHASGVVFTNMCYMTEEFLRSFPNSPICTSAYIVWISHELSLFMSHFIKQVFVPQTSLTTLTECVGLIRMQCQRLCKYGVDICYQLDGTLRPPLNKFFDETRDKLIDSIKLRSQEDKWIPLNLNSKSALAKFLREFSELGLDLDAYVTGDYWLQLTSNTTSFAKMFLTLLDDCLMLQTCDLLHTVNAMLYAVFEVQTKHVITSLSNERQSKQREFIIQNADFLLVTLINLSQVKFKKVVGFESKSLNKLKTEHAAILKSVTNMNRSIKYSSNEYL